VWARFYCGSLPALCLWRGSYPNEMSSLGERRRTTLSGARFGVTAITSKIFYKRGPATISRLHSQPKALLGFDAAYLYVAFRAHDEAGKVRATVAKRDAVSDDDNVGIYLDTFNDKRRASPSVSRCLL
jgi:hypothetical protein